MPAPSSELFTWYEQRALKVLEGGDQNAFMDDVARIRERSGFLPDSIQSIIDADPDAAFDFDDVTTVGDRMAESRISVFP